MESTAKIFLAPRKAGAAIGGHPWVYAGNIGKIQGEPADGDAVEVYGGDDGRFIAHGFFNSRSEIRVRLYSWHKDRPITAGFLSGRIAQAVALRKERFRLPSEEGAVRLVHSEGDGLSGLVVDQYGGYLVVQMTSLGLANRLEGVTQALLDAASPKGIVLRAVAEFGKKEGLELTDRVLFGDPPKGPVTFDQDGLRFEIQLGAGQKTGFYLDQRENRLAVSRFAGKRKVLDLHTYTGGFALYCAKAGAREVVGVDSSAAAIAQAKRHAELNRLEKVTFIEQDVFEFIEGYQGEPFELVILDPPKLARSAKDKERALRMYHRLNRAALRLLGKGGILVSSSCSGAIQSDEFLSLLGSAARRSGRLLQVLEVRGAGRDHPFSIHCPESRYLKCVTARAD